MTIHLATDHAGYLHKEAIKTYLEGEGLEVMDHGAFELVEDDDYPDFVALAGIELVKDPDSMAIVFGGSGEGEAMVANRINGVRATVYYGGPLEILTLSREHNASNMLSIGARFVSIEDSIQAVKVWLKTPFSNEERHVRRLNKF